MIYGYQSISCVLILDPLITSSTTNTHHHQHQLHQCLPCPVVAAPRHLWRRAIEDEDGQREIQFITHQHEGVRRSGFVGPHLR